MAVAIVLAFCLLLLDVVIAAALPDASTAQHVLQQQELLHEPPSQITLDAPRKLHGRFLHITDLHPDEFYKIHSSTAEEDACHRGKGPAGTFGAETSDCDSPFSLVNATFDWIADNLRDQIDFVVWTGDSARHDSDEQIPRTPAGVLGTNKWITSKFLDVFSDPKTGAPTIPVVPTLGNNDILPHNILLPGPNKWLQQYAGIWRPFIPEEQRHAFEFGGWFYVEVIPNRLAVFSLNTMYFFDRNAGVDDCAKPSEPGFRQMEWLRIQLEFMRRRGVKALLMGHVPPARTDSKTLWDETCWQKYTLWLRQFRDVVVGSVYGHMNIDHFLLQDTRDIDLALIEGNGDGESKFAVREAMEDEMSVESTADYLQELRAGWSKLPKPLTIKRNGEEGEEEEGELNKGGNKKKGKGDKKKKKELGGPWAERYQLSLIGPSIVPNYFPSLRVVEYNISGLEDAVVWSEVQGTVAAGTRSVVPHQDDVEWLETDGNSKAGSVRKDKDKKKPKKDKMEKKPEEGEEKDPSDPNLTIPDPPAQSSPPGPAYSSQPLTLLGYTQYFANLTHINNDMTIDDDDSDEVRPTGRWRDGKHSDKDPKAPGQPRPRTFAFEVEYSTFDDKIYNLRDLTVHSFVRLAYRMGQATGVMSGLPDGGSEEGEKDEQEEEYAVELKREVKSSEKRGEKDVDEEDKKRKKDKKKKENADKLWFHFLRHAFVSSVDEEELRKL